MEHQTTDGLSLPSPACLLGIPDPSEEPVAGWRAQLTLECLTIAEIQNIILSGYEVNRERQMTVVREAESIPKRYHQSAGFPLKRIENCKTNTG